jgi:hypothetical protein
VVPNFYVTVMFDLRSKREWACWIPLIKRSPNPPERVRVHPSLACAGEGGQQAWHAVAPSGPRPRENLGSACAWTSAFWNLTILRHNPRVWNECVKTPAKTPRKRVVSRPGRPCTVAVTRVGLPASASLLLGRARLRTCKLASRSAWGCSVHRRPPLIYRTQRRAVCRCQECSDHALVLPSQWEPTPRWLDSDSCTSVQDDTPQRLHTHLACPRPAGPPQDHRRPACKNA